MPGAGLTAEAFGKARSDRLALKPYWGKPAVRNFRGGDGDVGIMRSPVRAIALPDSWRWQRTSGPTQERSETGGRARAARSWRSAIVAGDRGARHQPECRGSGRGMRTLRARSDIGRGLHAARIQGEAAACGVRPLRPGAPRRRRRGDTNRGGHCGVDRGTARLCRGALRAMAHPMKCPRRGPRGRADGRGNGRAPDEARGVSQGDDRRTPYRSPCRASTATREDLIVPT